VEERLDIDTPENVVFDYQVAGIGSRFIAALIDTLILGLTLFVFNCGAILLAGLSFGSGLDSWIVALYGLLMFASIWGYYIFFEMVWNGQSPGKRRAGLRVVRTDGTPITLVDSLIRNLVRIIDFLPLYYAVGTVTMFLNSQARRLGDYAAGTLVVKEQRDVTLESIQRALNTGVAIPDAAALVELSESDYQLMGDFLRRRHELQNRDELAQRIAAAIAAKLGLPRPSSARDAEELLARLARQSRRQ
jgi:uncharacterized RDD family membrane protein YckC